MNESNSMSVDSCSLTNGMWRLLELGVVAAAGRPSQPRRDCILASRKQSILWPSTSQNKGTAQADCMQASQQHNTEELQIEADAPAWRALPQDRAFTPEFLELRPRIYGWIEDYYDRDHLTRAGDWMLALEPEAPEYLVVAALLHDLERKVPGGPQLDIADTPWDDRDYNDAHTYRSAVVVPAWLTAHRVDPELAAAVAQPIRQHEFGGSPDGDLMQAVDSISFLETNAGLL